jgi:hypothetical protein
MSAFQPLQTFGALLTAHMPLVGQRWGNVGLIGGEALLGKTAPDGSQAPYFAME